MQELHTTDSESSLSPIPDESLIRTPSVTDSTGGAISEVQARERNRMLKTADQVAELAYNNGLKVSDSIAASLLPTPITRDYKDGSAPQVRDGVVSVDTVARAIFNSGEVTDISWGKFEPAIRRWEELTRSAPAPTMPDGRGETHRLSSKFSEWMMGLPDGWITDSEIGLSRKDQLKACGNGVVPQQAEMALRILLGDIFNDSINQKKLPNIMPTPTSMDHRDGTSLRNVAIKNLEKGLNRGISLNHLTEGIGVDWNEGDTFEMVDGSLRKRED